MTEASMAVWAAHCRDSDESQAADNLLRRIVTMIEIRQEIITETKAFVARSEALFMELECRSNDYR